MIYHITRIRRGDWNFQPGRARTLCGFKGQTTCYATEEEKPSEKLARLREKLGSKEPIELCESCSETQARSSSPPSS